MTDPKPQQYQQPHHDQLQPRSREQSSTAAPQFGANFREHNANDDYRDKPSEAIESGNGDACSDREKIDQNWRETSYTSKEKDVDVLKQLPEARELLKTIPLEHRKKVRHIIKVYEDERRDYETEIRRLCKLIAEGGHERRFSQTAIQIDILNQKEDCEVTLTPTSLCFSEAVFEQVSLAMGHDEVARMNHYAQFMNEGFDHTRIRYDEELALLGQQVADKSLEIRKKELKIEEFNSHITVLEAKVRGYEDNLRALSDQNQGLLKKIQDVEKSVKQRREETRPEITVVVTKPDQTKDPEPSRLGVHKDLTIQNRMSTSPPDRSPTYSNKHPKISLRDELNKSYNIYSEKKEDQQNHLSECDSSEFGKEKVVEKRKLRKLFTNLLSASQTTQKRDLLEKLSIEIGLKTKDINSLFKSF